MAAKKRKAAAREAPPPRGGEKSSADNAAAVRERPETVVPPNWAPNMLIYSDISRMLFRMHRNVSAHMDAHKRLAERMQAVFMHEQAMVLELARLIDESMMLAARKSNEEKPPLGRETIDRVFDHARGAMTETGRMLTDIQLESLALLRHYIDQSNGGATPVATRPEVDKGMDKK